MKIIKCDLCGADIPSEDYPGAWETSAGDLDFCNSCLRWFDGLDLPAVYLQALKARWVADHPPEPVAEPTPPEVPPDPDPAPEAQETASGIKGRYAPLKRAVLEALEEYRKTYGPGVKGLAARAGVKEAEVELVRMRRKVPLAVWKGLAEALGVEHKEV